MRILFFIIILLAPVVFVVCRSFVKRIRLKKCESSDSEKLILEYARVLEKPKGRFLWLFKFLDMGPIIILSFTIVIESTRNNSFQNFDFFFYLVIIFVLSSVYRVYRKFNRKNYKFGSIESEILIFAKTDSYSHFFSSVIARRIWRNYRLVLSRLLLIWKDDKTTNSGDCQRISILQREILELLEVSFNKTQENDRKIEFTELILESLQRATETLCEIEQVIADENFRKAKISRQVLESI